MSNSRREQGKVPEPPRTLAIVIACVVGLVLLVAIVGFVNLLR